MTKIKPVILLVIVCSIIISPIPWFAQAQTAAPQAAIGAIITSIDLPAQDILYDWTRDIVYASVPDSGGSSANSIVAVDILSGTFSAPIFVGSNPNAMALSQDGQYLYVGIDGEAAVRRVDLITHTAELTFTMGSGFCGVFVAEEMVVLADNPRAVAVARRNLGCSPRHEGVAIYDDGIQRAIATDDHTGSNVLEYSNSASILYGYDNESSSHGFRVMAISSSGITVTAYTSSLIGGSDIVFANGLIYAGNGAVIEPDTPTLLGTFAGQGSVYPDVQAGQVYILNVDIYGTATLKIFDQQTFVRTALLKLPGKYDRPTRFIKVAPDVFAFRTRSNHLFRLQLVVLNYSAYLPFIMQKY